MSTIVGVDPGQHGAVARLSDGGSVQVVPIPLVAARGRTRYDIEGLHAQLASYLSPGLRSGTFVLIELPPIIPKAGVFAARAGGYSEGMWSAFATCFRVPFEFVPAKRWQAAMLAGTPPGKTKARAEQVVRRLWPGLQLPKARPEREGWCDALLIAEYGRRSYCGRFPDLPTLQEGKTIDANQAESQPQAD